MGIEEKKCVCTGHNYLVVERKYVSKITFLLILIACFLFTAGYFMGKYHAVTLMALEIEQKSIADQLQHTMSIMYQPSLPMCVPEPKNLTAIKPTADVNATSFRYYAQLACWGSLKTAQDMVNRLQKKGIATTIVKHVSKAVNQQMQAKAVYQVVTPPACQGEIEHVVALVKKFEHITNPQIKVVKGA